MRILIVILLLIPVLSHSAIRACTDENGRKVFRDTPCLENEQETRITPLPPTSQTPSIKKNSKEIKAVHNCFEYAKNAGIFDDPYSARLEHYEIKWVSVRDIGARQMVYMMINTKNSYGTYAGAEPVKCLLMGDGETVNTNPYQLLK